MDYYTKHYQRLLYLSVIFFVTAFGFLLIAGSNGWIK